MIFVLIVPALAAVGWLLVRWLVGPDFVGDGRTKWRYHR